MLTPFMAANYREGVQPQVRRYVDGTPTTVGVAVGALDNNTGSALGNQLRERCRWLQFGGVQTFLQLAGGQIWRSTNKGASWTSVHTLANMSATLQSHTTGLHVLYRTDGTPVAALLYRDSGSNRYRAAESLDGVTWNEYGPFAYSGFGNWWNTTIDVQIFQGKLVWTFPLGQETGSGNLIGLYDTNTQTVTFVDDAIIHRRGDALVVFNDELFRLSGNGTSGINLRRFLGTSWNNAVLIAAQGNFALQDEGQMAAFTKGGFIYALWFSHSDSLWHCTKISNVFATTAVDVVVPAGMVGNTGRCFVIYDTEANPGAEPDVYVYFSVNGDPTSSWNVYKFVDDATPMTLVQSGGNAAHALPARYPMGGEYFWTDGEYAVEIVGKAMVPGGEQISFKVYSENGTDIVNLKLRRGVANDEFALTQATVSGPQKTGPSPLPTLSGNDIMGVTADNGATIYSVKWEAVTDGFTSGARAKRRFQIF